MAKGKRKNIYETVIKPNLDKIRRLKSEGKTNEQIAKVLGIGASTLYKYQALYVEVVEVLEKGVEEQVINLEKTAYSVAMGTYLETTEEVIYNRLGEVTGRKVRTSKRADTTMLIFLLKVNAPEKYANIETANKGMVEAIQEFANKLT